MTTSGRGQVWTGEQLAARLAAQGGVAPEVTHRVVYRAMDEAASAASRDGYLVPGESGFLAPAAFDFWLARHGVAGAARLGVAVLVVRAGLSGNGEIDTCALEFRRGAMDGPYHGSPARITFAGPVHDVRFYQATPDGQLDEIAPTPDPGTQPRSGDNDASAGGRGVTAALATWFGRPVHVLGGRAPTVIEAMVGIAHVLHLDQPRGRELGCGILWHGPVAVALPAAFPRFDVAPRLSPGQQSALAALVAAERLVVCETRRDDQGIAVLARRKAASDLVLVRFEGETPRMTPYEPGLPPGITEAQAQWIRYIETYEQLRARDAYHDRESGALIVITDGTDGQTWRHAVDEDGVETWRTEAHGASTKLDTPMSPAETAPPAAPPVPATSDLAPFGPLVDRRFPGAAYDIEEATRSLASGRATAAVFHAARIVAHGLDATAAWRGETSPPHQHGEQRWRIVMRWVRNDPASAALHEALDTVRVAWRGTTLQVGPKYTEAEARQILAQVERFIRCLAALCDEDGVPAAELDDDTG